MCEDQEKVLLPFQSPCCIQIVGPTQSGKTMLTYKILAQSEYLFTKTPKKTIYCYSAYQDLFSEMERKIENITFHEGLPTSEEIDKWSENKANQIIWGLNGMCNGLIKSDLWDNFYNTHTPQDFANIIFNNISWQFENNDIDDCTNLHGILIDIASFKFIIFNKIFNINNIIEKYNKKIYCIKCRFQ